MPVSTPPDDAQGIGFGFIVHDLVNPGNDDYMPQMGVVVTEETWNNTASVTGGHDKVIAALDAAATAMYDSLTASFPSPDYEVHGRFAYHQTNITDIDPWPAP